RERGRAYPDIVNGVIDGRIKGLWIVATNPVVSFPNRELLEDAFRRLDLLVVQDGFSTPTTDLADVVLPAAIWGEKDGTFTNSERRVSRVRKVVDPPGEARSDFDVFLALADRLGVRDELFPGWTAPEDAFGEWARVSAGRLCDYGGMTWDAIEAAGGLQWGGERLYTDGRFPTPDGRARLHCVDPVPITDRPRRRFPLLLNTGRTVEHWHTRTKTGRVEVLERLAPEAWVEVNPADARTLGVGSGDVVRLVSERGAVERIVVRVTSVVREGEVFVPFHYDEACANRLTLNEFDPISREPNYKQCAVRLEKSPSARH
ncbi:MAG TPA: molybdopterin dinucleotide binding domain-containing protein, partial [Acidimicrobiales bacterium]|nr:molybdopterin dinucleotide binding domain-containing protein [Acidimicrobiales bacterium]